VILRFTKLRWRSRRRGRILREFSKDLNEHVGNLIAVQKDFNSVARATTMAHQKSIVSETLELDVDHLSFLGIHILIYLGEQKKFQFGTWFE
jgi:hypothetical protein